MARRAQPATGSCVTDPDALALADLTAHARRAHPARRRVLDGDGALYCHPAHRLLQSHERGHDITVPAWLLTPTTRDQLKLTRGDHTTITARKDDHAWN